MCVASSRTPGTCACACVFLPMPYKKKCLDAVYLVYRAHNLEGKGDNEEAHMWVVTPNGLHTRQVACCPREHLAVINIVLCLEKNA